MKKQVFEDDERPSDESKTNLSINNPAKSHQPKGVMA